MSLPATVVGGLVVVVFGDVVGLAAIGGHGAAGEDAGGVGQAHDEQLIPGGPVPSGAAGVHLAGRGVAAAEHPPLRPRRGDQLPGLFDGDRARDPRIPSEDHRPAARTDTIVGIARVSIGAGIGREQIGFGWGCVHIGGVSEIGEIGFVEHDHRQRPNLLRHRTDPRPGLAQVTRVRATPAAQALVALRQGDERGDLPLPHRAAVRPAHRLRQRADQRGQPQRLILGHHRLQIDQPVGAGMELEPLARLRQRRLPRRRGVQPHQDAFRRLRHRPHRQRLPAPGGQPLRDPRIEDDRDPIVQDGRRCSQDLANHRRTHRPGGEQLEQARAPLPQIQSTMHRRRRGRATRAQRGTDLRDQLVPVVHEPARRLLLRPTGVITQLVEPGQHGRPFRLQPVLLGGQHPQASHRTRRAEPGHRTIEHSRQRGAHPPAQCECVIRIAHIFYSTKPFRTKIGLDTTFPGRHRAPAILVSGTRFTALIRTIS
nr:hypothetical protein [Tsukamurella tyrosinosolvens]